MLNVSMSADFPRGLAVLFDPIFLFLIFYDSHLTFVLSGLYVLALYISKVEDQEDFFFIFLFFLRK